MTCISFFVDGIMFVTYYIAIFLWVFNSHSLFHSISVIVWIIEKCSAYIWNYHCECHKSFLVNRLSHSKYWMMWKTKISKFIWKSRIHEFSANRNDSAIKRPLKIVNNKYDSIDHISLNVCFDILYEQKKSFHTQNWYY